MNDVGQLVIAGAVTASFTDRRILVDKRAILRTVDDIEQKSGISRRAFLGGLFGAAAAVALTDTDKFLWTPTQKTVFVPPVNTDICVYSEEEMRLVLQYMGDFWPKGEAALFGRSPAAMLSEEEFQLALHQAKLQLQANDGVMYPRDVEDREWCSDVLVETREMFTANGELKDYDKIIR